MADKPQRTEAELNRDFRAARQKFKAALAQVNAEFEACFPAGGQRSTGNREGMQRLGTHIEELMQAYDTFSIALDPKFAIYRRFGQYFGEVGQSEESGA